MRSPLLTLVAVAIGCADGGGLGTRPTGDLPEPTPTIPDPCGEATPFLMDLGEHPVDDEDGPTELVTIGNTCLDDLTVTDIRFDQLTPPFVLEPAFDGPFVLRAGEARVYSVRFLPTRYISSVTRLRFVTDDEVQSDVLIAVRGTGVCADGSTKDSDEDFVPDGCDVCPGGDDLLDYEGDGVPDACDYCPYVDDKLDEDFDGVADPCDICPIGDDTIDSDVDGVPDACDICPLGSDFADRDADTFPDACDICDGFSDFPDGDLDGVPDGCDLCQGFNDGADEDKDTVPDGCDECPGFDDRVDTDKNDVPDGCDV